MLSQFVDSIVQLAIQAKNAKVIELPGKTHYALQEPGGAITIKPIPRPPKKMTAHNIAGFVKLMQSYLAAEDGVTPNVSSPIITVADCHAGNILVTGYPAGLVQEDAIELTISPTPEFRAMALLEDGVTIPDFVKIVRRDLFENVPPSLLNQVRSIDFAETSRTAMVVQGSGRESMGRSVELQTKASGQDVPDAVPVQFPVIQPDTPIPGLMDCEAMAIVQIDTKNQKISLVLPKNGLWKAVNEAAKAVAAELQVIFDRLTEEGTINVVSNDVIRVVCGR